MVLSKYKISNYGKSIVRYASTQIFSNVLRLLSGFLVVRMLDPELYGKFTGFGIFLGYIFLGQGGIIQGLSRELPYEFGKRNYKYGHELASSVYVITIIVCFFVSVTYLVLSIYNYYENNILAALICLGYVIIGGLEMLNRLFLPTLYKTSSEFKSLGNQNVKVNIVNFGTVLLVYYFSIYGLIIRAVLISLIDFILKFKNKPFKLNTQFSLTHMKILLKTGLPMFATSQAVQLWLTFINNLIFSIGGAINYGLFGLSNIIQNSIGIIPRSISQMIFPKMTVSFGQGISVSVIIKSNIKPLIFQFFIMLFICVIGYFLLPVAIPLILPNYIEGIGAAQWIIFIPLVQSFSAIGNIYATIKKMKFLFWSNVLAGIISLIYIFYTLKMFDFQLEFFAQGLLLGSFLQQFFMLFFIHKILNEEKNINY